jgi:hypothetical protein
MTLLAKLRALRAAYKFAKPWLERPWVKTILGLLAKLFTAARPVEQKDAKGWTETGRKTFDSRLDPKD